VDCVGQRDGQELKKFVAHCERYFCDLGTPGGLKCSVVIRSNFLLDKIVTWVRQCY